MQYLKNLWHKLFTLLLLALLFFVIFLQNKDISVFFKAKPPNAVVTLEHVKKLFPQANAFQLPSIPEAWGKVMDSSGNEIGGVASTSPYADSIEGFGGPVPFLIGLHPNGQIVGISLLENAESESFLEELNKKKFFHQWNGLKLEDALKTKVDTVSGATATTSAVIRSFHNRMASLTGQAKPEVSINVWKIVQNSLAMVVFILAYFSFLFPKKTNPYRVVLLIVNVIVLGFVSGYFISTALTCRWLLYGISWTTFPILTIIVLFTLAVHIFSNKQFYCSHVCPYGCAQEIAGKILAKKPNTPAFLSKIGNHSRKVVFGVLAFLLLLGCNFDLTYVEPFSAFLYSYASWSVIILALVFFIVSFFYPRFWCRYLCPTGQLLEIFCRVPKVEELEEDTEEKSMKFYKILVLLLVLVIIILLIKPHLPIFSGTTSTSSSDALSVIFNRKSVRKYLDKPVSKEDLNTLLKAGMSAPTGGDKRPWAFVVVTEKEKLVALADGLASGKMLKEAGAAIVVCGVTSKMFPGPENKLPPISKEFWIQDCSAVTENILLAVEALKLGAVWIGGHPLEDRVAHIRKVLNIPDDIIPLNVISIGYPTGIEKPKDKYDEKNIHWNNW